MPLVNHKVRNSEAPLVSMMIYTFLSDVIFIFFHVVLRRALRDEDTRRY